MLALDANRNDGYTYSYLTKDLHVTAYSVADAKNRLPRLIDKALAGEQVIITRRGKPVAELRPVARQATPAAGTHEWLRARTRARPSIGLTSVQILDLMYDSKEG